MTVRKPNPKCCICGDAYGTRFVCTPCAADPANVDWVEGNEELRDERHAHAQETTISESDPPTPSQLAREIVLLLLRGKSRRAIAVELGCSHTYVQKIAAAVGL